MKLASLRILGLIIFFSSYAHATRQIINCKSIDKNFFSEYKIRLDFDPEVQITADWKKDEKGQDYIQTIKIGNAEDSTSTTAHVVTTNSKQQNNDPYSGKFLWTDFYSVNVAEDANSGYSYYFDKQAYRGFHGSDKYGLWDMMFYYPESVVGKKAKAFKALLTAQMDLMEDGYYHIDLECNSRIK